MWVIDGEDAQFPIDFTVDGDFVIPSSATATIRDQTGAVLVANEPLPVDTTSALLEIPGANNALAPGSVYENRFVVVVFVHEGRQHRQELSYRVRPFVAVTATPKDVRRELGLDPSELPDDDIDVYSAYLTLEQEYGIRFVDALSGGNLSASLVQKAIAVRAAIELTFSLPFRAGVRFASEGNQFQRKDDFDPVAIRIALGQRLSGMIDVILQEDTLVTPSMSLATPVDVITGA